MPTEKTTEVIATNFFPDTILLLHMVLKNIQVGTKLTRWRTIIGTAVNSSVLKKFMLILLKMICNT